MTDRKPAAKKGKLGNSTPVQNNSSLFIHPYLQWKPQVAMSMWVNDQLHNMVTVAIGLTAGVDIEKDVKVYVSDNKNELIVSEKMIKMVSDVDSMHKHWRNKDPNAYPPSCSKIMGFHSYFSGLRKRENDDLFTTAIIKLPFPVQKTVVSLHQLGDKSGARLLYVDLRAVDYNDYRAVAKSSLVMID